MRRRVQLGSDLPAGLRDAHRNALLTLPRAYEIVEAEADFVVTRPGGLAGSAVHVVAGIPFRCDGPDAVAATVVDWDPVVAEFVEWIAPRRAEIVGIHISVWSTEEGAAQADGGKRLAGLLIPGLITEPWRVTRVGSTTIASSTSETSRVAVSAGTGIPSSPELEVKVIGHGFTAALAVSAGLDARPSDARMTTPEGSVSPARPYSSAFRRLWLHLADEGES